MRTWLWMLAGLLTWAAHFIGLYGLASLADVVSRADDLGFRWVGGGFSLACLMILGWLGWNAALRARRSPGWPHEIALGGALVGGVGVLWQSLPLIVGH